MVTTTREATVRYRSQVEGPVGLVRAGGRRRWRRMAVRSPGSTRRASTFGRRRVGGGVGRELGPQADGHPLDVGPAGEGFDQGHGLHLGAEGPGAEAGAVDEHPDAAAPWPGRWRAPGSGASRPSCGRGRGAAGGRDGARPATSRRPGTDRPASPRPGRRPRGCRRSTGRACRRIPAGGPGGRSRRERPGTVRRGPRTAARWRSGRRTTAGWRARWPLRSAPAGGSGARAARR